MAGTGDTGDRRDTGDTGDVGTHDNAARHSDEPFNSASGTERCTITGSSHAQAALHNGNFTALVLYRAWRPLQLAFWAARGCAEACTSTQETSRPHGNFCSTNKT